VTTNYKRRALWHVVIAWLCLPLMLLVSSVGVVSFLATLGTYCMLMFGWYAWRWFQESRS
jgi:hypothetical protein